MEDEDASNDCYWRLNRKMDRIETAAHGAINRLWDWDLTTNRIHFSSRLSAKPGSEESMFWNTPQEWFKRIHPEDLEQVKYEIRSHLENGSNQFTIQHRMLHNGNSYGWMSCRGVITRNTEGKAIRITGSYSDTAGDKIVDDLTGLPSRIPLLDHLTRSIETTRKQSGKLYAVLIMDLELPENVADCLGAKDRNLLLVTAARRLETWLRAVGTISTPGLNHIVARSEGDEFIILIDGLSDISKSVKIAERLLKEISVPFEVNGRELLISANVGMALSATGYQTAQEALRDADMALYRSKLLGKGRYEVFDTAILKSLEEDTGSVMTKVEGGIRRTSPHYEASMLPTVNPGLQRYKIEKMRAKFKMNRTLILTGSATMLLLFTIGLLDSYRNPASISPTGEMQMPVSEDIKTQPLSNTPDDAKNNKTLPVYIESEPPSDISKTTNNKKSLPVYEFQVVHDHFMGSCRGTLKAAHDTLSYIAENEKCSFNFNYNEFEFSMDEDRLEIKTESKNYHFESINSLTEEENSSQIQAIYKYILQSKS